MSPGWTADQKGVKVQIVDVFALRLATGYDKDPTGRLRIQAEPSVSQGRTWSLAKACQLIRNDANPHRWVVLHRHKKAWGLFWAGGGLELCREELSKVAGSQAQGAIVPATPDALLRLILAMEEPDSDPVLRSNGNGDIPFRSENKGQSPPWKMIAIASLSGALISLILAIVSTSLAFRQQEQIRLLIKEVRVENAKP